MIGNLVSCCHSNPTNHGQHFRKGCTHPQINVLYWAHPDLHFECFHILFLGVFLTELPLVQNMDTTPTCRVSHAELITKVSGSAAPNFDSGFQACPNNNPDNRHRGAVKCTQNTQCRRESRNAKSEWRRPRPLDGPLGDRGGGGGLAPLSLPAHNYGGSTYTGHYFYGSLIRNGLPFTLL